MIQINSKNSFKLSANFENPSSTQEPLERKVSSSSRRVFQEPSSKLVPHNKAISNCEMGDFETSISIPFHLRPDVRADTSLIHACIENGDALEAFDVFEQMLNAKVQLDEVTYNFLVGKQIEEQTTLSSTIQNEGN